MYLKQQEFDCSVYDYFFDMANKRRSISGDLIRQNAELLDTEANVKLPAAKRVNLNFS